MKHRIIKAVVLALGLCAFASLSMATELQPQKSGQPGASSGEKASANKAAAKKPAAKKPAAKQAAAKKVKPMAKAPVWVDLNSASREELKKLPGIGDAEADKILKGRPFLSKAQLQTDNIVSPMAYQSLRNLVVANQKDAKFGKAGGK